MSDNTSNSAPARKPATSKPWSRSVIAHSMHAPVQYTEAPIMVLTPLIHAYLVMSATAGSRINTADAAQHGFHRCRTTSPSRTARRGAAHGVASASDRRKRSCPAQPVGVGTSVGRAQGASGVCGTGRTELTAMRPIGRTPRGVVCIIPATCLGLDVKDRSHEAKNRSSDKSQPRYLFSRPFDLPLPKAYSRFASRTTQLLRLHTDSLVSVL